MITMDYSALTRDDKIEIFDITNSVSLRLKGEPRKALRRKFVDVWKQNKSVGCFELFMALFKSYEIMDKQEELWKREINPETSEVCFHLPEDWATAQVTYKKYKSRVEFSEEQIYQLEQELDKIREGKGYISEEQHKEMMETQKKEFQMRIRDLSDQVGKWRNKASAENELRVSEVRRAEKQAKFFKRMADQLSTPDK